LGKAFPALFVAQVNLLAIRKNDPDRIRALYPICGLEINLSDMSHVEDSRPDLDLSHGIAKPQSGLKP